jgi:hypothetical protein
MDLADYIDDCMIRGHLTPKIMATKNNAIICMKTRAILDQFAVSFLLWGRSGTRYLRP